MGNLNHVLRCKSGKIPPYIMVEILKTENSTLKQYKVEIACKCGKLEPPLKVDLTTLYFLLSGSNLNFEVTFYGVK